MDISERLVTAMMQRELDIETGEQLLEIHTQVCSKIQCHCGKVMSTFSSALFGMKGKPGGVAVCGECIDKVIESVPEEGRKAYLTITDFRDYDNNFQLKKKNPPVKTPKAPKVANVRLRSGENCTVAYSRRFTEHGLTFFIHGEQGEWEVSCWDTGMRLNTFKTQKAGIERVQGLNEKELRDIRGAISLHGGLNPSVKGGVS